MRNAENDSSRRHRDALIVSSILVICVLVISCTPRTQPGRGPRIPISLKSLAQDRVAYQSIDTVVISGMGKEILRLPLLKLPSGAVVDHQVWQLSPDHKKFAVDRCKHPAPNMGRPGPGQNSECSLEIWDLEEKAIVASRSFPTGVGLLSKPIWVESGEKIAVVVGTVFYLLDPGTLESVLEIEDVGFYQRGWRGRKAELYSECGPPGRVQVISEIPRMTPIPNPDNDLLIAERNSLARFPHDLVGEIDLSIQEIEWYGARTEAIGRGREIVECIESEKFRAAFLLGEDRSGRYRFWHRSRGGFFGKSYIAVEDTETGAERQVVVIRRQLFLE